MKHTNDGLSLWYNTPDAPAPLDEVLPRRGITVVVGAAPASPANAVAIQYRVDRGPVLSIPARELRTDWVRGTQYFCAELPAIIRGETVEYVPVLSCGGRQAPAPHQVQRSFSRFSLEPAAAVPASLPSRAYPSMSRAQPSRTNSAFSSELTYLASVYVQFDTPQFVGEQADGVRVNFFAREGRIEGAGFSGKVVPRSSDQMLVRRDGMGIVRICAVFETTDGALLDVESGGYVDFGEDGHRHALAQRLPDRAPIVVTPLITAADPRYGWLSRVQCVGVGETNLDASRVSYHVYAAGAPNAPAAV